MPRKIVIEQNIPYIKGRLEPWFDSVVYAPASDIDAALVADADAIVTRTRTRCDAALLDGSAVRLIATATIGTDHIDLDYCRRAGIKVASAPGCNAPAVAQWALATILAWQRARALEGRRLSLGVVGVGHVGSIVARWAGQLGYEVLPCDPPRERADGGDRWVSLNTIADRCDIITVHTPLNRHGADATFHLLNERFIGRLAGDKPRLLMNAARGAIASTQALLAAPPHIDLAIDCWENEPDIDKVLLQRAFVATPHIAGYSSQGKLRATAMAIEAVNRHFGIQAEAPSVTLPATGAAKVTTEGIAASYNPLADTRALKASPEQFELLRNRYALRDEVH